MIDFVLNWAPKTISFLAGATIGSLITFNFCKKSASKGGTVVDQSYAHAGKDVVGGNKTTIKK